MIEARTAAVRVDAVRGAGATLGLTQQWASLRQTIQQALRTPTATPVAELARSSGLSSAAQALIAPDANNSRMVLDPDSDFYSLMDGVLNRLPALVDAVGQTGDLQTAIGDVISAGGFVSHLTGRIGAPPPRLRHAGHLSAHRGQDRWTP